MIIKYKDTKILQKFLKKKHFNEINQVCKLKAKRILEKNFVRFNYFRINCN